MWMLLVLFYGLCKGAREIVKKKAMVKSTVMEVLLFYTLVAFVMVLPQAPQAGGLEPKFYFYIALKSLCIFVAWICSFKALKKMPISLYGVLDLSRVLFATFLGVIVLGEVLGTGQILGLVFVSTGLLMLKFNPIKKKGENSESKVKDETVSKVYVIAAFASCLLNAVSGLMDKILMKDVTSSQLQFWYMLFLTIYYILYFVISRTPIRKETLKNGWIWLLALLFVLADKALFVANGSADSRVTVMTLIKQSGCIVTILGGKFVFKEKGVGYKLICACVVIFGIILAVAI